MNPTITDILRIREKLVVLYKNNETIVLFVLKFLMGLVLFTNINKVGHYQEGFTGLCTFAGGVPYTLGLSVLFAVAPPVAAHFVLLLAVILQISLSLEVALVAFLIGACVMVFYCRLQPNRSFLITAILLGYFLKVPYAVVLFAGLYVGFAAIVPVIIGTAVWNFLPMFNGLVGSGQTAEISELADVTALTDSLSDIYVTMQSHATGNLQWIFSAFIFAMVIILVYAVSRLTLNYSKELSVLLGGLLCIFGNIMSAAAGGTGGVGQAIVFTLLSIILVMILRFFDIVLDYKKVRYVEFEDENNYYYVKIIHKLIPDEPEPRLASKRARPVRGHDEYEEDEEYYTP